MTTFFNCSGNCNEKKYMNLRNTFQLPNAYGITINILPGNSINTKHSIVIIIAVNGCTDTFIALVTFYSSAHITGCGAAEQQMRGQSYLVFGQSRCECSIGPPHTQWYFINPVVSAVLDHHTRNGILSILL